MKRIILMFLVVSIFSAFCFAQSYEDIINYANTEKQKTFDALARDVGALLGGGVYHNAKTSGLLGLDLGIRMPVRTVDAEDKLLKDNNTSAIGLPALQIEKSLPENIDLIVRGASGSGATAVGGAIRYNVLPLPIIKISGILSYNQFTHEYIKATTTGIGAVVSVDIPVIKPYVGFGTDSTDLTPGTKATQGNPLLEGTTGKASGTRMEAGINLSFPFFYLFGGVSNVYNGSGYVAGLGLSF